MDYKFTDREGNNFDLIRMVSAYLVILSHATAIQGRGIDIVVRITGQTHSGQMAVFIFTFLSGIFITKSIVSNDVGTFFIKRFLRLYPELILCLIMTLIVGGVFTSLSPFEYWTNQQTWKYFLANLLEVSNEHILPGVFENHPIQGMNGVLWYITFIVRVYLILIIIKTLGLFDTLRKANITFLIMLCWVISKPELMPFIGGEATIYGEAGFPQYTITLILGALVYLNEERLKLSLFHVIIVIASMWIFRHSCIGIWVWAVGYVTIAMVLGTEKHMLSIKIKDLSYGIFLYGWPIGQLVYEIMPNAPALVAAIATALVATIVAFLSENVVSFLRRSIKVNRE